MDASTYKPVYELIKALRDLTVNQVNKNDVKILHETMIILNYIILYKTKLYPVIIMFLRKSFILKKIQYVKSLKGSWTEIDFLQSN